MRITVEAIDQYDQGIHPEVTEIRFLRENQGDFFDGDRFPNLYRLAVRRCREFRLACNSVGIFYAGDGTIDKIELNCPSLTEVWCDYSGLTQLRVHNGDSLRIISLIRSNLTVLELDCPRLQYLDCSDGQLVELNLMCPRLVSLACRNNRLTSIQCDFSCLKSLFAEENPLTSLPGLEFSSELEHLYCSKSLKEHAEVLKIHLPNLKISIKP